MSRVVGVVAQTHPDFVEPVLRGFTREAFGNGDIAALQKVFDLLVGEELVRH
jgi:hypothetical protein